MGSKYSNRPPPRKKLWICQKSPTALAAPPSPLSLTATVSLRGLWTPPGTPKFQTTFLLLPMLPGGPYDGTKWIGADFVTITLHWIVGDVEAYARGSWRIGLSVDIGQWTREATAANSPFRYQSGDVAGTLQPYESQLLITS